jgi:hypothetical protein
MSQMGHSRRYGDVRCWRKADIGRNTDVGQVPILLQKALPLIPQGALRRLRALQGMPV